MATRFIGLLCCCQHSRLHCGVAGERAPEIMSPTCLPGFEIDATLCLLQLALVNKHLERYFDAWYSFVNSWIIIEVADPNWVFDWRLEVCGS